MHLRTTSFIAFGGLPTADKTSATAAFYVLTRLGNEAVVCFFVLSGFLVGGKAFERLAQSRFNLLDFAIDRFVRIMLPLVPALILTALIMKAAGAHNFTFTLFGNLFALQGISVNALVANRPLWSLSYEVWFYVLTGAVGWWLVSGNRRAGPLLILVLITLVFTRLSPAYLICWLIGALSYLQRPTVKSNTLLLISVILILYSIAIIEIQYGSMSMSAGLLSNLQRWTPNIEAARIILSAGFALITQQLVLTKPRGALMVWFDGIGASGARWSYSLYLTHYPILFFVSYLGLGPATRFDSHAIWQFLLLAAASLLAGRVSYWLFERHTPAARALLIRQLRRMPLSLK